jgi:predicted RNA-binding Zn-ribbon protein involved in translation (DUF1610 family)
MKDVVICLDCGDEYRLTPEGHSFFCPKCVAKMNEPELPIQKKARRKSPKYPKPTMMKGLNS